MQNKLYDLTNPQKSIWYTEQFFKGTAISNITGVVFIKNTLDFKNLSKAINIFISKNDSFRTKFVLENDKPKQYIEKFKEFKFDLLKISSDKDIEKEAKKMATSTFDILSSYLFEFKLFKSKKGNGGFVINAHHLIFDAWSSAVGTNQIINIYSALVNKEALPEIEYPSYLDFIESEKEYIKSEKFQKDKSFWEEEYNIVPESADIPSVDSKLTISSSSSRELFSISPDIIEKINEFCKGNRASIFNFFMGILAIYLGRVSNLDEFVIGTPILNRTNFKEKNTTGMFISTVPFKVNIDHTKPFGEFISEIGKQFLEIFRHQKYPYQYLLEALRKKESNLPNLYNIMMSYQNARSNNKTSEIDYMTKWITNDHIADSIDIHLFDLNDTGTFNIAYDYRIDKYSKEDIQNIHKRFLNIIDQILENDKILLNQIEIVTPEEKHQILYEFNNTKADYPKDKTISQLFEEQVEKTPDNIAVIFEDQQLTYKELNEKANSLAYYLRKKGVKPNSIVGIKLPKNCDLIISILAVLKIGACYLPISLLYPKDRVSFILKNSKASLLICNKNTEDNLNTIINTLILDLNNLTVFSKNNSNIKTNFNSENLCYIMYTSGSTGEPKGAMISHQNLLNFIFCFNNCFNNNFNYNDNCLSITNISFDVSICEIFTPLLLGSKLFLYYDDSLNSIPSLCDFIIKNKISFLYLPPNILNTVSTFILENYNKNDIKINKLLVGVESIKNKELNYFLKINNTMEIVNGYGPTEATICSTFYKYNFNPNAEDIVPIGVPLTNNNIYILHKTYNLQPIQVVGDLYVCGANVGLGYINNIIHTKKSFLSNLFGTKNCYNTGDLAYWDKDGNISFMGRKDSQVKISGHRIELEEINNRIKKISDVKKSITIIKKLNGINKICSFIVSTANDKFQIKNYLRKYLPEYMIPNYIVFISDMPITPNGKIDISKLPAPDLNENKEIILPRNKMDRDLINIIKELLNIDNISIEDSFFDIGGDSLTSINLSSRIYSKFNIELFVKDILLNPIIKDLSDYISSKEKTKKSLIPIADKKEYYIASSAQKRMYYASNISGDHSLLYNIAGGVILDKMPDVKKLSKCFNILVNRHESLRTSFDVVNNEIVQVIKNKINFKLEVSKEIIKENKIEKFITSFITPFDLNKAPLFKSMLVPLENNKSLLLVNMHHIISDGKSLEILVSELCKLYNDDQLDELKITYKDYAEWEKSEISSGNFKESEEFWLKKFEDEVPVLNMPTEYTRPVMQSFEGDKILGKINPTITKKIFSLSKELNITPYMLLISIYYILLSKYTSQEDIIIGSPIIGRDISELNNIIGMFVNTLPLRNTIDSEKTFKEFLYYTKENCLEAFKYQTYPFDDLINKLKLKRDTSRNPLFDTMFIYQNNGNAKVNFNDINATYYIPNNKISKVDLSLEILPEEDFLTYSFEYCTKLFSKTFIKRLSSHYINILNKVLDNIDEKLSDICMLSEEEKHQILYEFNDTKVDYPKDKTISQLFEEQVEKTPDNIAVVFENQELTYTELNEKANSLAYYLRKKGVKPNSVVAIMVNRSLEMIIGILAILKAGGAYLPIDPEYPEDRIKYMLEDSNAKIILVLDNNTEILNSKQLINISLENSYINDLKNNCNLKNINPPTSPAYLIYTSGSTGNPKGVVLNHKALTNLTFYLNKNVIFFNNKYLSIASITTVCFDIFIFETLICLQRGIKVFIANKEQQNIPSKLNKLIIDNNIKILQMTPSRMKIFIDNANDFPALKNLNYLVLAGEPLPDRLLSDILSLGIKTIYNGYGPSETTVFSTFTDVSKQEKVNIGHPISNTQIYILDKNLCPLPIGIPGEIYIAGDGLSNGYLNNKNLNKSSFINNPFIKNTLMYKSGDFAKFLDDGEIFYLERIDNQVKIRGLRIELGEIENKILEFNNILKVKVIKQVVSHREFISAYFISDKRISITDLRKYLSKFLPNYMVPSYFIAIDKFEYNSNGKININALPLPNDIFTSSKSKYTPPKTDLQVRLVHIWEQLLSTTPIGINDNFFELGGDSILAMNLNVEILKFSKNISYEDIFNFPTIEELAKKIDSPIDISSSQHLREITNEYSSLLNNMTKETEIKYSSPRQYSFNWIYSVS